MPCELLGEPAPFKYLKKSQPHAIHSEQGEAEYGSLFAPFEHRGKKSVRIGQEKERRTENKYHGKDWIHAVFYARTRADMIDISQEIG